LPPDSLFHALEPGDLRFAGASCERLAPLVFRCGPHRVEADVVSAAVWGVHLCMRAPRIELTRDVTLGRFIAGSYDSVTREATGRIRVAVDGQTLGDFATEPPYLQQQFVQFDTPGRHDARARLTIELEGSALDCFDFRVVR
jgi:hypothetical protein